MEWVAAGNQGCGAGTAQFAAATANLGAWGRPPRAISLPRRAAASYNVDTSRDDRVVVGSRPELMPLVYAPVSPWFPHGFPHGFPPHGQDRGHVAVLPSLPDS
jgi:hypothetical protein